jgi:hypothetical protein
MGPRGAALALKRFLPSVRVAIPCHYATFGLLLPDASGFVREMEGANARVLVPPKGQAVTP